MSAIGTKRTWRSRSSMSAFGVKADIAAKRSRAMKAVTTAGGPISCAPHISPAAAPLSFWRLYRQ